MQEKLNMDEAQVAQIQELMNERRQAQRESGRARMEMMKTALPNFPNPNPGNNAQNGGNGGNAQNGGNGGNRNRFNDPAVREAMKKFWESPETKAKMAEYQSQDEKINNQFLAAVNRVLSKRQSAAYKKMLGAPFDLSKIRGGPGQGPGNRNANANPAGTAKAISTTEAATAAPKPTASKAGTTSTPSARTRKKSLRELRGIPDKSE